MTPRPAPRRGIPLPREHGAWVMLYAPLLTGLVVYNIHPLMCLLLIAMATAVFFAQNALGLLLRERGDAQTWWWLGPGYCNCSAMDGFCSWPCPQWPC